MYYQVNHFDQVGFIQEYKFDLTLESKILFTSLTY